MLLRRKLVLAALPSILVVGALGAHATRQVAHLSLQADRILRDNYRTVTYVQRLSALVHQVDLELLAPEPRPPADLAPIFAECEQVLALQEANITEPGEEQVTRELRSAVRAWRDGCAVVASSSVASDRLVAWAERVRPRADAVGAVAQRILAMNTGAMERKAQDTSELGADLRRELALLSIGAVASTLAVALVLAGRISRPLVRVTRAARQMGEGNLSPSFPEPRDEDEVAVLVRELSSLAARLREYRESSLGDLIAARETAQAAIDSLRDPVLAFGADGGLRSANRAAGRALGVDADAPDPLAPLPGELRVAVEGARDQVLRGLGAVVPQGLEGTVPLAVDQQPRELQVSATPIQHRSGGIVGVSVLLRDVTALRRAQVTKDELLSAVAHELRTPLTSVRMAIHLCLERVVGAITAKQEEVLLAARRDAERLHEMIEGILRVSRLEAGGLVARRRPVPTADLLEPAVAPHRVAASDRGVALVTEVAPGTPAVLADPESVAMALSNFVSNALKHVPEGGHVTVRARAVDDAARFEVEDDGPGVPPEHQHRIFERFYRVPGSPPGGVGLGLSIARDIALAHGGQIGVESRAGGGAVFWLTLPRAPSPPAAAAPAPDEGAA